MVSAVSMAESGLSHTCKMLCVLVTVHEDCCLWLAVCINKAEWAATPRCLVFSQLCCLIERLD